MLDTPTSTALDTSESTRVVSSCLASSKGVRGSDRVSHLSYLVTETNVPSDV